MGLFLSLYFTALCPSPLANLWPMSSEPHPALLGSPRGVSCELLETQLFTNAWFPSSASLMRGLLLSVVHKDTWGHLISCSDADTHHPWPHQCLCPGPISWFSQQCQTLRSSSRDHSSGNPGASKPQCFPYHLGDCVMLGHLDPGTARVSPCSKGSSWKQMDVCEGHQENLPLGKIAVLPISCTLKRGIHPSLPAKPVCKSSCGIWP